MNENKQNRQKSVRAVILFYEKDEINNFLSGSLSTFSKHSKILSKPVSQRSFVIN